jgi:hypothetical protein
MINYNKNYMNGKYSVYETNSSTLKKRYLYKPDNIVLNPRSTSGNKVDSTFSEINNSENNCSGKIYKSSDPRLYNQAGTWLHLDKPPLNSSIKLDTLTTDKSLNRYGQGYNSYDDINAGQCSYYINDNTKDVFHKPILSTMFNSVNTLYQDPMGTVKPHYDRVIDKSYNYDYCLSFIKDTQYQREDIMSLQMRRRNQEVFGPTLCKNK